MAWPESKVMFTEPQHASKCNFPAIQHNWVAMWRSLPCQRQRAACKPGTFRCLGNYICLHAVAQWTWPCFQAMPWAKQYKKGTVKCICPGIGLSMPGTSQTGSYATGNVTCFWYQMVCGQSWHSVRNIEKPDKVTLYCHLLGLCWVLQSFIYIIWWWNKGTAD